MPVIATLVMVIGSSVLLFAQLGHYSLWTDEASTAITAAGVWRTGDTSAWLDDHNLLTYRDGLLLKHQKDRYTSPLQFYLAAPFIGLLGHNAFACRLPFALCGLGTVVVILCWLRRAQPPRLVWIAATSSHAWLHGFLTRIWWNIRDLIACDFVILPLLIVCPAVGNAEVRYLAPLLPLCIGISILAVWGMEPARDDRSAQTPVLSSTLRLRPEGRYSEEPDSSDVTSGSSEHPKTSIWEKTRAGLLGLSAISVFGFHSSTLSYYRELWHPSIEPCTPVAQWVDQNVPAGSTAYVCPDMCTSPMIWDAPKATYVWQLSDPPRPDYAGLPGIYFKGRLPPDYLIAFGPYLAEVKDWQSHFALQGVYYEPAVTIPVCSKEMFRPELIWRSFTTIEPAAGEEVYIFRRMR